MELSRKSQILPFAAKVRRRAPCSVTVQMLPEVEYRLEPGRGPRTSRREVGGRAAGFRQEIGLRISHWIPLICVNAQNQAHYRLRLHFCWFSLFLWPFLCPGDKAIWQILLTANSQQRNEYVVQWLLKKFYSSGMALWHQVPKKVILRGAAEHPATPVQIPDMDTAFFFSSRLYS